MTEQEPRECPIEISREEFILAVESQYQFALQEYTDAQIRANVAKLRIEELNGLLDVANRHEGEGLKVKYFLDKTTGTPSVEMSRKKGLGFNKERR